MGGSEQNKGDCELVGEAMADIAGIGVRKRKPTFHATRLPGLRG